MSVEIQSNTNYNQEEKEVLNAFKNHVEALIKKDKNAIEAFLAPSFQLIHMAGNAQPRSGFIDEVMGGVLNYYSARLINPQIQVENYFAKMVVDVNFDAKVYGSKGNWTLHSKNTFQKINNQWYFIKWDNM